MKLPVSACLIHKNDPKLRDALECVAPHVEEICVASNGTDEEYEETRRVLLEVCEAHGCEPASLQNPGANDEEGHIADFSALREDSFSLATQPWALWLDTDDVVDGLENLGAIIDPAGDVGKLVHDGFSVRVMAPYEFAYDDRGQCVISQWRERLVSNPARDFQWVYPVHEGCVAKDREKMRDVLSRDLVWRHRRQNAADPDPDRRNLRIVRRWVSEKPEDPRAQFYLGLETMLTREDDDGAASAFEKYLTMSDWAHERCAALVYLVDLYWRIAWRRGPSESLSRARDAAERAVKELPTFDSHFAQAKVAYAEGMTLREPDQRMHLLLAIDSIARGLATKVGTPMAVCPRDRKVGAFEILRDACSRIGRLEDAARASLQCVESEPSEPEHQFEARRHAYALAKARGSEGMDVAFLCPPTFEKWDPETVAQGGQGGSETAVVEMGRHLAKRGHRVRVYGDPNKRGVYEGVEYRNLAELRGNYGEHGGCDVLVAWRYAQVLDWMPAKVRVVWAHDLEIAGATADRLSRADRVLALSDFHAQVLAKRHSLVRQHFCFTRNGIDLSRFEAEGIARDPHKAVYSSSPDRGLGVLLDVWPRIRARVPDATLDVYYGFGNWIRVVEAHRDFQHAYVIERMTRQMRELDGVTYHGRKNQKELAEAFLGAGVWAYPTHFDETSCCTAMEAQAAGLRIVSTARGALNETVGARGALIEGNSLSSEYQDNFVDEVVKAMESPFSFDRDELQAYARQNFGWDTLAEEWEKMLAELASDAEFGVLPPYVAEAA